MRQATLPGFAPAAFGLVAMARRGGRAGLATAGSGVLVLLSNLALIVLLGFDFDELRVALFRPYPLVCYGVAAPWASVGLDRLAERLAEPGTGPVARAAGVLPASRPHRGPAALAALALAALVMVSRGLAGQRPL